MKILLTNDDGINAEGLSNLYNLLSNFGETIIVAPEYNQSTKSHSISLNTPLRVKEVEKNKFALTGLPADCVNFAIVCGLLTCLGEGAIEQQPDYLKVNEFLGSQIL